MFVGKIVLFQLSPTAQMYIRVGKITVPDVPLSYENRDKVINMPRCGSARAYDTMDDMRRDAHNCEFDIYPFASDPQLVECWTDPFSKFIDGLEFES